MDKRVAVMSIIVENNDSVEKLNSILHDAGEFIIGRMGIPYREKNVSVISVVIDAPQDLISAMSGKIGNLNGVTVKTAYSNVMSHE
ncbi:MAG: iron-only hydrogenase system regulator [Ruminococcus sp.]|nr:iron-only hydrogenase system regulator [Ruminococcus sp.]